MFNKRFYEFLAGIATAILTVYGLIELPAQIKSLTNSTLLGTLTAVLLTLILGAGVLYHFLTPYPLKRFGVKRYKTEPILVRSTLSIDIDENFVATIKKEKELLFTEKPTSFDLVDLIEVSNIDKLDEKAYFSNDSRVVKFIRQKKNTLAIYWEPTKEIIPNTIYKHSSGYISPSLYGDDGFWHSLYIDLDTGIISVEFTCKHELELAIAFKMPYLNSSVNYKKLDKLAFIKNRRDCSQPEIAIDKKTIKWTLTNPSKHRSYLCFAFYKDGVSSFRKEIKYNWLERLFN